jgi:hypothetical protein
MPIDTSGLSLSDQQRYINGFTAFYRDIIVAQHLVNIPFSTVNGVSPHRLAKYADLQTRQMVEAKCYKLIEHCAPREPKGIILAANVTYIALNLPPGELKDKYIGICKKFGVKI